jgi:hypothetical protein
MCHNNKYLASFLTLYRTVFRSKIFKSIYTLLKNVVVEVLFKIIRKKLIIQGVSGGIVNILGGGSMDCSL